MMKDQMTTFILGLLLALVLGLFVQFTNGNNRQIEGPTVITTGTETVEGHCCTGRTTNSSGTTYTGCNRRLLRHGCGDGIDNYWLNNGSCVTTGGQTTCHD